MLEKLYNGDINPSEKYIKKGGEYEKINKLLVAHLDELTLQLNDKQLSLLEKIQNEVLDLCQISEKENFIEGFRLGMVLILQTINFQSQNFETI